MKSEKTLRNPLLFLSVYAAVGDSLVGNGLATGRLWLWVPDEARMAGLLAELDEVVNKARSKHAAGIDKYVLKKATELLHERLPPSRTALTPGAGDHLYVLTAQIGREIRVGRVVAREDYHHCVMNIPRYQPRFWVPLSEACPAVFDAADLAQI